VISPSRIEPNHLRGRVLAVIVEADEPPDAASIAGQVLPVPLPAALRAPGPRQYRGIPRSVLDDWQRAKTAAYREWAADKAAAIRKVSRIIGQLTETGLVREMVPPHASPLWWSLRMRFTRAEALARLADGLTDACDEEEEEEIDPDDLPTVIEDAAVPVVEDDFWPLNEAIMARVEAGPPSFAALLGPNPSGRQKRVYRALCESGAIIAPTHRQPTETGKQTVEGWYK
jgi:hypothetical protein